MEKAGNAERIFYNAQEADKKLGEIARSLKNAKTIWRCFHLRPTADGITLVSTLDYAPMRGVRITVKELGAKLSELDKHIKKLVSVDKNTEEQRKLLGSLGFEEKDNPTENTLEEDIQAAFITGMLAGETDYEGINFLASEMILQNDSKQDNRFDVLGYKGDTLYIFELKRGRTTKIFGQIERYRKHFEKEKEDFHRIFAAYPKTCMGAKDYQPPKNVEYIAVMQHAENTRTNWKEMTDKNNTDVWFFKKAYAYSKIIVE